MLYLNGLVLQKNGLCHGCCEHATIIRERLTYWTKTQDIRQHSVDSIGLAMSAEQGLCVPRQWVESLRHFSNVGAGTEGACLLIPDGCS